MYFFEFILDALDVNKFTNENIPKKTYITCSKFIKRIQLHKTLSKTQNIYD
jgi:CxxC motif-containing protein